MQKNNQKIYKIVHLESIFQIIGTLYVFLTILSSTLAIFSLFNIIIFSIVFLISILGGIYSLIKWKIKIQLEKLDIRAYIVLIFLGIFSFAYFHHTLYGVRDEGVYANSAIGMTTKSSIYIKDFINFPGWIKKGNLFMPGFLFGTISWIALNYALFGLNGIYLTNFVPIIIGGLSYYYIAKKYIKSASIYLLFCFFLSYPLVWFTRRTVSEIIFFSILWFSFYLLRKICFDKETKYILPLLLSCSSYILIRGEGMIYLFFTIMILIIFLIKKQIKFKKYYLFGIIFFFPFIYYSIFISTDYILLLQHFIIKIIAIFVHSRYIKFQLATDGSSQILHTPGSLYYNIIPFTLTVFSNYNLLFFIFSILIIMVLIIRKRMNQDNVYLLLLILINAPTFYSLLDLTIAPDQPWFLRRFVFSVIPISYLCGFILINKYVRSTLFKRIIFVLIIIINLVISSPILVFSEYKDMHYHIDTLASNFESDDLLLVDPYAAGWYRMATELYFRKQLHALYLTVIYDINNHASLNVKNININTYKNIYIITNKNSQISNLLNPSLLTYVKTYPINYNMIISTSDLLHQKYIPNYNILNLKYNVIKPLITIPQDQYSVETDLIIYKVISKKYFKQYYNL